jgi:molybdopterin-containing oxidoreductase family iron-sulfur binding subunit
MDAMNDPRERNEREGEPRYWQSIADLAAIDSAAQDPAKEFPGGKTLWEWVGEAEREPGGETRRDFLKWMGFGVGSAGVLAAAGCRIPERRAVPLVSEPEELVPGAASWYATTCGGCAAGCGLLVKTRDGRPIKIEGNPDSPLSGGGTCAAGQATVLSLYDVARFPGPRWQGKPAAWSEIDLAIAERLGAVSARGQRIVLLSGPGLGPSFRKLLGEWQARFPGSRHLVHEPLPLSALRQANAASFGRAVVPHYRFDRAKRVVALEADFLGTWLSPVEFTRQYTAARRSVGQGSGESPGDGAGERPADQMLRHVQIETQMTLTGSNADLRIPVLPSELGRAALVLLAEVSLAAGASMPALSATIATGAGRAWESWEKRQPLAEVAADLWAHRGESLVVCGENDPALQAAVNQLNSLLGNVGRTLDLERPSHQSEGDETAVAGLVGEMERGEVGALLLLGVNPVYDHPEGARFARALEGVPLVVSFADRPDETTEHAHAVVPDLHFLEAWDDAEPVAGLLQLRQPTIAPLFDARPAAESLLRWMGRDERWYDYVRQSWREGVLPRQAQAVSFDELWDRSLERGVLELQEAPASALGAPAAIASGTAAASAVTLPEAARREGLEAAVRGLAAAAPTRRAAGELEVRFYPSVALRDGRWANNPWLQELPDPLSKMTWGNWIAVPPALATRSGIADGDVVALAAGGAVLELPAVVQPGLPDGAVAVALGYGRTHAGKVADGVGKNAFPLRPVAAGFSRSSATGFQLKKTGRSERLARTQTHFSTEGRPIVLETTAAALRRGERIDSMKSQEGGEEPSTRADLWPEHEKPEHFWGMVIDLSACTGCSACVVACQAENNVAVVGKDEVTRNREMHWIRIDRYYRGTPEAPQAVHQPMMCQHCDHAPCETVCPVLATVHSSDGLNQQVYNRCIGTRYCANNCPYKVRRFNWFHYAENDRFDYTMNAELPRMVLNPDVGIRSRGVMEKCSLCIQRIQEGKLAAKKRGEKVADGAIQTACQQACPADAIVFGDRKDAGSELVRQERDPRYYRVLEEVGTRPGVGYLAKVRNAESLET